MRRWLGPRAQTSCALVVLVCACWFVLFHHLGAAPLRVWDEIRLADNAIEMVQTGNLLVTRYDGKPEVWNTKPPLQIWLEALSVKLIGIQSLAFRLPSALAALATVLVLFLFARRELDDLWSALLTVLLLLTSAGFVLVHCARNGEYDAMLVLWLLSSSVAFFRFVWRPDRHRWLWLTALFIVLAAYTKGVHGLLLLPGMLIYVVATRQSRAVFGQRSVYVAAGVAVAAIGAYYGVREQLQPGYLSAVWENELFGRYATVNEGHTGNVLSYLVAMRWWTVMVLFALPALFVMKGRDRKIGIFTIIMAAGYMLVISLSKTKLEWYVAPVYPFLSLFVVVALRTLISWLRPRVAWTRPVLIALTCGATLWFLVAMVIEIDRSGQPQTPEERYLGQLSAFRQAVPGTNNIVLGTTGYQGPALYYQAYFADRGLIIQRQRPGHIALHPGDTILTSVDAIKETLRNDYGTKRIFLFEGMEGDVITKARAGRLKANDRLIVHAVSPSG